MCSMSLSPPHAERLLTHSIVFHVLQVKSIVLNAVCPFLSDSHRDLTIDIYVTVYEIKTQNL